MKYVSALVLGAWILLGTPAQAHLLKVFAFADGSRIEGSTYFVGGIPAAGAKVEVQSTEGRVLATLEPDAAGDFSYDAQIKADHVIVADTGDGHVARWTVTAAELTGEEAASSGAAKPGTVPPAISVKEPNDSGSPVPTVNTNEHDLSVMVEEAVAREVRPLRKQLIAYEEKARLRDIVGGIGYILGLAGLAAWWHQRRKSMSQ